MKITRDTNKTVLDAVRLHGSTYQCWADMKSRCTNPRNACFKHYGGRGITVCDRWLTSFSNFFLDMGEKPNGLSLDRIDNEKGYSPENCRWVDWKTQSRNNRRCIYLTYQGETLTATDWAARLGCHPSTIMARKHRGWTDHDAIATPIGSKVQRHKSFEK